MIYKYLLEGTFEEIEGDIRLIAKDHIPGDTLLAKIHVEDATEACVEELIQHFRDLRDSLDCSIQVSFPREPVRKLYEASIVFTPR